MYILERLVCNEQTNDVCPQVEHMGDDYAWDAPDSVSQMRPAQPLAVAPNLRSFHLDPETNVTDLVSQGFTYVPGLLASEAFRAALEGRTVQAHETWPATVVHHGESFPYGWLHVTEELDARIDFGRSEFTVRYADGRVEDAAFADAGELDRRRRELTSSPAGSLHPRRVVFVGGTPSYDLFTLLLAGRVFYVSDLLAEELVRRNLTGFELLPTESVFMFE